MSYKPQWYILDENRQPVRCDADKAYARKRAGITRVGLTAIGDNIEVSTVFLGLDQRCGDEGPPILFETMVFRNGSGEESEQYATWEEAERGHTAMVETVKNEHSDHLWKEEARQEIERLRAEKQEIAQRNALYVLEIAHWRAKADDLQDRINLALATAKETKDKA